MKGYSKELEEKLNKQVRKERAANGQCSSKMMSFRIDAENVEFLNLQSNKGRLINDLLRRECERRKMEYQKEMATE